MVCDVSFLTPFISKYLIVAKQLQAFGEEICVGESGQRLGRHHLQVTNQGRHRHHVQQKHRERVFRCLCDLKREMGGEERIMCNRNIVNVFSDVCVI